MRRISMRRQHAWVLTGLILVTVLAVAGLGFVSRASAQTTFSVESIGGQIGLGDADLRQVVLNVIRWVLGILTLTAVVYMMYGGYLWLTAAGNEKRVEKAKQVILQAAIGLVIVLLAWAIVLFVTRSLANVTNSSNPDGGVICEMADFFEPRAMEKGLKINAMVPKNLPLVMGDAERIRQVISNLVYNAIKFTNNGGIVIWAKEKDGFVQVGIQDTGVGIPKEKIGHLFQKFECLKDTRDRVAKPVPGSGLGLVIVKNSIQQQGGSIWVESEIDKGTTFIFTLPLAPASAQTAQPPAASGLSSESSMLSNREPVPPKLEGGRQPVMMDNPDTKRIAI